MGCGGEDGGAIGGSGGSAGDGGRYACASMEKPSPPSHAALLWQRYTWELFWDARQYPGSRGRVLSTASVKDASGSNDPFGQFTPVGQDMQRERGSSCDAATFVRKKPSMQRQYSIDGAPLEWGGMEMKSVKWSGVE